MYICSPKWVYRSKKLAAQKIWVSYLQFQGGDFRPLACCKNTTLCMRYTGRPQHRGDRPSLLRVSSSKCPPQILSAESSQLGI